MQCAAVIPNKARDFVRRRMVCGTAPTSRRRFFFRKRVQTRRANVVEYYYY